MWSVDGISMTIQASQDLAKVVRLGLGFGVFGVWSQIERLDFILFLLYKSLIADFCGDLFGFDLLVLCCACLLSIFEQRLRLPTSFEPSLQLRSVEILGNDQIAQHSKTSSNCLSSKRVQLLDIDE